MDSTISCSLNFTHRGKHRLGDAYVVDHFPAERQQRLLGGVERRILVLALLDAIDLPLGDADAERDRNAAATHRRHSPAARPEG